MKKKYRLTDETKWWCGHTLHRIEALKDFGSVKKGDKGGWIESENNLSHDGDCWVGGEAKVYDNAQVRDNARVYGNALVYGSAVVRGDAIVRGDAVVSGNAQVRGGAIVCGDAVVSGNAQVRGYAEVCGDAELCGDAVIKDDSDYLVFKNFWSSGRYFTWTRSNNKWKVGCFYGTGDELIKKAYEDDEKKGEFYQKHVEFVEMLKKC